MNDYHYRDVYYEEPHVQAEFERLLQRVHEAEQKRSPLEERQRAASRSFESGQLSNADYRSADDAFIAANNAIAGARRAVDDFLKNNRNYKTR